MNEAAINLTREAEANLEEIANYVAQDSSGAAQQLIARLRKACLSLAILPGRGASFGYKHRRIFEGRYQIVYRVERQAAASQNRTLVHIVAIHHTARNIDQRGF